MDKKETYIIQLKDMPLGTQEYSFQLGDEFFERIEAPEVKRGSVAVKVSLKKSSHSCEFTFVSDGFVYVPCDRCLEDMKQEITSEDQLVVKFGDEYEEVDDKLVVIPDYPGEIDLSWFMYEFIALAIPIQHVHPEGECSEEMMSKLNNYLIEERTGDEEEEDNSSKEIDPRWEGLRKLLDKEETK
ncbi:MAG: DUF177 domain-containing protein [Paludibacteraceae bacterium]|nr:DUF177 domain-containing protein [Paludibacteraceae bacterium]